MSNAPGSLHFQGLGKTAKKKKEKKGRLLIPCSRKLVFAYVGVAIIFLAALGLFLTDVLQTHLYPGGYIVFSIFSVSLWGFVILRYLSYARLAETHFYFRSTLLESSRHPRHWDIVFEEVVSYVYVADHDHPNLKEHDLSPYWAQGPYLMFTFADERVIYFSLLFFSPLQRQEILSFLRKKMEGKCAYEAEKGLDPEEE